MSRAQLTWKAHGSTRCVGCGERFTDDGRAVVEKEATDCTGARPGYSAAREVQVVRRWHETCLADFERATRENRSRVEAEQRAMLRDLAASAGLPDPYPGPEGVQL